MKRWPSRSSRRATSVVELLVAAGVLLVVLTIALQILLGVSRFQKRAAVSYELNQQTLAGLTGLTRDLAGSKKTSTNYPDAWGVIMIGGTLDGPTFKWNRTICYFWDRRGGVDCLLRSQKPIDPPTETAPDTSALRYSDFPTATVVARDVQQFVLTRGTTSVDVKLQCGREEMGQRFSVLVNVSVPYLN